MKFRIEPRGKYLHAELEDRRTPGHMRQFLEAVKAACLEHGCPNILISIRGSAAVFRVTEYGLDDATAQGYVAPMLTPSCRIALLGDSTELNHAHDYIELVARQQKVNLRSFRENRAALLWLLSSEDVSGGGPGSDALQPTGPSKLA